jgi:predicted GNAT family acetyltransferase
MDNVSPEVRVVDHDQLSRYELLVDDQLAAVAIYQRQQEGIVFSYTELMSGFEGRHLGDRLAAGALDDIREQGLTVRKIHCPFIGTFIEDHPEYATLVA